MTYATLNIPGSDNNLTDTNPDPAEYAARNAATIAWMQAFAYAESHGSERADAGHAGEPGLRPLRLPAQRRRADPQTLLADQPPDLGAGNGYDQFLLALRAEVIDFSKPVLLVRRLALLPHRQATPRPERQPDRAVHAGGDARRQPGHRQHEQRLPVGEGDWSLRTTLTSSASSRSSSSRTCRPTRRKRPSVNTGCPRSAGAAGPPDPGYNRASRGAIAQLGERLDRTQEVGSSSLPSSISEPAGNGGFFLWTTGEPTAPCYQGAGSCRSAGEAEQSPASPGGNIRLVMAFSRR